jgi:hypothetical protein
MLRRLLHGFGYLFAHLLFIRANTPTAVVRRLRIAYRLVGVRIVERPQVDGIERTIFLCPYRNLGSRWFDEKWICHDILDRVDDGYVTYLRKHKDIEYMRPTGCGDLEYCDSSRYCYSEVENVES